MIKFFPYRSGGTLVLLFLFFCKFSFAGASQESYRITLSADNIRIADIFKAVKKQTGLTVFYGNQLFNDQENLSIHFKNAELQAVFDQVFKGKNISWSIKDQTIVLQQKKAEKEIAPVAFKSTDINIQGKVSDEHNDPMIGVTILIKGTGKRVVTDDHGHFSIAVSDANAVLVFTFVGYKELEVKTGGRTEIQVKMNPESSSLNEVVTIGYATVNRKDLTGAVSSLNAKQLKDIPINSAAEALAGRLAGVQVMGAEGSPGADVRVRVRGGGSVTQDNSPLYIVDGIQVENALSNLSPQDIESIDVLKDAASTAIYGARGANGVILITTKGGRDMKTTVNYNGFFGVNRLARELPVMHPYDFLVYQYERSRGKVTDSTTFANDYGSTFDTLAVYRNTPFQDWQKIVMDNPGYQQTHNLSISGGSKATTFNVSYTNNTQKGIVALSDYSRQIIGFRIDHTANDQFKFGFNARYNNQIVDGSGTSSSGNSSLNNLRSIIRFKPFLLNGASNDQLDQVYFTETAAVGNGLAIVNPLRNLQAQYRKNTGNVTDLNGYMNYKFNSYFSFRFNVGVNFNNAKANSFDDVQTTNSIYNGGGQPLLGSITSNTNTLDASSVLSFTNAAANSLHHSVNILMGSEIYNVHQEGQNYQYKFFPIGISPDNAFNQLQLGTLQSTYPQITNTTSHLLSFFTRANYTFNKKYLLTLTARADGSSKFSPGHQWGYFPSAALAWRVSDENFMKNVTAISGLKFRLSYGLAGNNRISDYLTQTVFNATASYALNEGNSVGYVTPYLANPNLKWETTYSSNVGIDVGFFKNRLQMTVDVYDNRVKDLLISVPIAPTSGYSSQLRNVGETENKGIEVQFNGVILQKKNFTWSGNFNFSYNQNKVIALATGQQSYLIYSGIGVSGSPSDFIVKVGAPVGSVYGYQTDGFYKTADFDYNATTQQYTLKAKLVNPTNVIGTPMPGMIKFKDTNGDGLLTTADQTIIGNTNPQITGGLNQSFVYKNFDVNLFFNYQFRAQVVNGNKVEFTNGQQYNANLLGSANDRWRTIDAQGNVVERLVTVNGTQMALGIAPSDLDAINVNAKTAIPIQGNAAYYVTSQDVENGSFVRLNNVSIGYSLPQGLLRKIKVSRLRVYVTGNNLALITSYTGYDPEVNTRRATPVTPGIDYSAYPRSRTFLFGINLTL